VYEFKQLGKRFSLGSTADIVSIGKLTAGTVGQVVGVYCIGCTQIVTLTLAVC